MALPEFRVKMVDDYKLPVLVVLIVISLLLELVIHWYFGIDVVYSHFFYIPVVLAGIWYGVRGVPVAVLLGGVLIAGTYASTGAVDSGSLLRALMFVVVAVVIGAVSDLMRREQDRMIEDVAKTALRSDLRERGDTLAVLKSRVISVAGVRRLKERGDIQGLVRAVGNKDRGVQYEAVEALGDLRDPSAIPALMGALTGDQYSGIRWKAVEALTKIGPDSVSPLIEVLKNPDPDIRWKAAVALGEIGDPRGIDPLVKLLDDSDRFVRSRAAYALIHIGPPALPSLSGALNHPDATVRLGAVGVLGKIGDPQAISALVNALADQSPDVRQEAISALSRQGDRAIAALSDRLHDPDRFIRRRAVLALAGMKDEKVMPILLRALATADPDTAEVLIAVIEERQAREPGESDGDQDTANLLEMFNLT